MFSLERLRFKNDMAKSFLGGGAQAGVTLIWRGCTSAAFGSVSVSTPCFGLRDLIRVDPRGQLEALGEADRATLASVTESPSGTSTLRSQRSVTVLPATLICTSFSARPAVRA